MVDAHASGACGATRAGSSPVFGNLYFSFSETIFGIIAGSAHVIFLGLILRQKNLHSRPVKLWLSLFALFVVQVLSSALTFFSKKVSKKNYRILPRFPLKKNKPLPLGFFTKESLYDVLYFIDYLGTFTCGCTVCSVQSIPVAHSITQKMVHL